jgi:hypothetical protein
MGLLRSVIVALSFASLSIAVGAGPPAAILKQLPADHVVLSSANSLIGSRKFYIVALASRREAKHQLSEKRAPARPLLIFEQQSNGRFILAGRNDNAILRVDDGGINQCDPFRQIVVKGRYFTVENGVACGAHWTDYVTFRLDARRGYVFDNERGESWSMNSDDDPNAEALISNGVRVEHPPKGRIILFSKWRRPAVPQ